VAAVGGVIALLAGRRKGRAVITAGISSDDRATLERQRVAFGRTAGILKDAKNPEWETPEKTSAWVRKLRSFDQEATEEKLSHRPKP